MPTRAHESHLPVLPGRRLSPNSTCFDLLWICCTACCTTNPQQVSTTSCTTQSLQPIRNVSTCCCTTCRPANRTSGAWASAAAPIRTRQNDRVVLIVAGSRPFRPPYGLTDDKLLYPSQAAALAPGVRGLGSLKPFNK